MNLLDHIKTLLEQNDSFCKEGRLFKNSVVEAALKLDPVLLKLLLADEKAKKYFFADVEGIAVFDKVKFQRFVSNKEFLPDSFTAYKNKIGLTANGEYLTEANEVVLDFPYKDCVLEGGQTKEDQKRKEIFWNETLAPDEIDRLLEPKALTNWKKYDKDGEHVVAGVTKDDNLIIKGNNLLALHSLLPKYKGQVKLIYIDPPYNIGGDSFQYNDSFNHSSWLTFMANRLRVARSLLSNDGLLFVQIDHHEISYLNTLLDQLFDVSNKVQIIAVKVSSPSGFKAFNPGPIDVTEFILFYAKNKKAVTFQKNYVVAHYHSNYNKYVKREGKPATWTISSLKDHVLKENGFEKEADLKKKFGAQYKSIMNGMISDFAFINKENVASVRDLNKPSPTVKKLQSESKKRKGVVFAHEKQDGSYMYLYNGGELTFYSRKINDVDGELQVTELLSNFWNHISWAGIAKEGGVKLKNGKKPEKLLKQIIEVATNEGDLVLDFHLGSGTTAAVAHKMGRRYIGIEQLDYDENDATVRLKNVIRGDSSGISKTVNWKGGGSFVYAELAQDNAGYIDSIQAAKKSKALIKIWDEIKDKGFISYKVSPKDIDDSITEFSELSLDDQKKLLISLLDKNQLYVNYSDMDDTDHQISEEDKALNHQFYTS